MTGGAGWEKAYVTSFVYIIRFGFVVKAPLVVGSQDALRVLQSIHFGPKTESGFEVLLNIAVTF